MRIAVGVVQALDVAAQHRLDPDAFDEAVQVHHHAGLIAVGAGVDHAGFVGVELEQRAQGAVEFGIHQHQMFAVAHGLQRHARGVFDGAGHFDDGIEPLGLAQGDRVLSDCGAPHGNGLFEMAER